MGKHNNTSDTEAKEKAHKRREEVHRRRRVLTESQWAEKAAKKQALELERALEETRRLLAEAEQKSESEKKKRAVDRIQFNKALDYVKSHPFRR